MTAKIKNKKRIGSYAAYIVAAVYLAIVLVYVAVNGDDTIICVWDNLDGQILWLHMLKENDLFFKWSGQMNFLNGVDRSMFFISELKAYYWPFMLMDTFAAYIFLYVTKIIMVIASSVFLGKTIFGEKFDRYRTPIVLSGLMYGIMPTFPIYAWCFASMPFLLAILIKIYKQPKLRYYLILLVYPVVSDMTLIGLFICGYILLFFFLDWIVKKKAKYSMLVSILCLAVGYLVTEFRLVYMMFFSGITTCRADYDYPTKGLVEAIKEAGKNFLFGHPHVGSLHTYVILPVCLVYLVIATVYRLSKGKARDILKDPFNWIFVWMLFNAGVVMTDYWDVSRSLVEGLIPFLKGFSWYRTIWFNPFLWSVEFAIVMIHILDEGPKIAEKLKFKAVCGRKAAMTLVCGCFALVLASFLYAPDSLDYYNNYNALSMNFKRIVAYIKDPDTWNLGTVSYREYYSEDLFEQLKEDIGYDGELAIAFGMSPAVIDYNGISTLDGICNCYPLEYKYEFEELAEPELTQYPDYAEHFYRKGINLIAYLPGYTSNRFPPVEEAAMYLNMDKFREMGGKYVISRVNITNYAELGLTFVGQWADEESPYLIRVYQVIE